MVGAILNSKIIQKYKNVKTTVRNGHFFYMSMRTETRRQNGASFSLNWKDVCWATHIFAALCYLFT